MINKFVSEDELPEFPVCNSCNHYESGLKCKAFDRIPVSILINDDKHQIVLPGQKNPVVYEEKKK